MKLLSLCLISILAFLGSHKLLSGDYCTESTEQLMEFLNDFQKRRYDADKNQRLSEIDLARQCMELVNLGADPNIAYDQNQKSLVHFAAESGNPNLIELLFNAS